jgi:hypothetical protein
MESQSHHRKALDLAQAGKWDQAHEIVQSHSDSLSCLIHAYIHRVEGDLDNAKHWYGQAGSTMPDVDRDAELKQLFSMLG